MLKLYLFVLADQAVKFNIIGALKLIHHFAILVELEGGHATHTCLGRCALVLVHIHGNKLHIGRSLG